MLAALPDEELAARAGVPVEAAPLLRGAHDLVEARALAAAVLEPPAALTRRRSPRRSSGFASCARSSPEALDKDEAKAIVRELKAVGGNLRALRVALTGRERGPGAVGGAARAAA